MNPIALVVNLGRGLFNSAISYMMTIGYGVLYVFKLDSPFTAEAELLWAKIAFGLLQVICAIIVAHCTAKKLRVWPIACITAFSYTLVFLYNISTSKWGIALSVAGICGLLCMKMADKYAALPKHKTVSAAELENEEAEPTAPIPDIGDVSAYTADKKTEHAFSMRGSAVVGFSALLCTALALLAIAIPASRVKKPWKTYETIDTVMETIRAYEMAIITGEDMQIAEALKSKRTILIINKTDKKSVISDISLTEVFGISPIKDVIENRLQTAKNMLVATDFSISEIAEKLGYLNTNHFIRQFKSAEKQTPLIYRKNHS